MLECDNIEFELRSPYGNVISQLQNMYTPLAMILADVLPVARMNFNRKFGKSKHKRRYITIKRRAHMNTPKYLKYNGEIQ